MNEMTTNKFKELMKAKGVDNLNFIAPMKPLRITEGIPVAYKSSNDRALDISCKINTDVYDPINGSMIELKAIDERYGKEVFLIDMFISLLNKGIIILKK